MGNKWGVNLVPSSERLPSKSLNEFRNIIKQGVPGFQLVSMCESGTNANETAVLSATGNDSTRCLFAMGSYVGGEGLMFQYSSTGHSSSKKLSVPTFPDNMENAKTKQQTVALPYYIPCVKYTDTIIHEYETECLQALNQKLFVAKLAGAPFLAILLELILCGTGGELSNKFLASMGMLLHQYNVSIIVDEVMTGGRVGPNITLTSVAPPMFINQVKFITMGKFTGCGLVLTRAPNKPTEGESTRGKSTEASPDLAFYNWESVVLQLKDNVPSKRRLQVVNAMKDGDEEHNWGRGCLIFTSRSRPGATKGLKNRHLPMLENTKIHKGTTKPSEWTQTSVCKILMEIAKKWISEMEQGDKERLPFVSYIGKYVLETDVENITAGAVLEFVGLGKADQLAVTESEKRRNDAAARGGKCDRKAPAFIKEALGVINVNAEALIKRTRVGKRRKVVYKVDRTKLATW